MRHIRVNSVDLNKTAISIAMPDGPMPVILISCAVVIKTVCDRDCNRADVKLHIDQHREMLDVLINDVNEHGCDRTAAKHNVDHIAMLVMSCA